MITTNLSPETAFEHSGVLAPGPAAGPYELRLTCATSAPGVLFETQLLQGLLEGSKGDHNVRTADQRGAREVVPIARAGGSVYHVCNRSRIIAVIREAAVEDAIVEEQHVALTDARRHAAVLCEPRSSAQGHV